MESQLMWLSSVTAKSSLISSLIVLSRYLNPHLKSTLCRICSSSTKSMKEFAPSVEIEEATLVNFTSFQSTLKISILYPEVWRN